MFVNISDLVAGDVVEFYGAQFQIYKTTIYNKEGERTVYAHRAKWLSGNVISGYFGPEQDWIFQGNDLVSHRVVYLHFDPQD